MQYNALQYLCRPKNKERTNKSLEFIPDHLESNLLECADLLLDRSPSLEDTETVCFEKGLNTVSHLSLELSIVHGM